MAYRKPGVTVTQEFAATAAALAPFNLPNCIIGPAYRIYRDDNLGVYTGIAADYAYASQAPGTFVDIAELVEDFPAAVQLPVAVRLTDVILQVVAQTDKGLAEVADLTILKDESVNAFADVKAGDVITVLQDLATIVAARTDGQVSNTEPNKLITAVADLFEDVAEGDEVVVSGGTDVIAGTYYVQTKVDNETLILDDDFYGGAGSATDVEFVIRRETGANNQGTYTVREKLSNNELKLMTSFAEAESYLVYRITAASADIDLVRGTDFTITDSEISLATGLQYNSFDVYRATVLADYRALRVDLAANTREYGSLSDLEAVFGVGQIVPANPLAYGLSLALLNAVTKTNGLGLDANFLTDEALAYTKALDVVKKTELYALVPLTHNTVVHAAFSLHVTQMSLPERKRERVAIVNRTIITTETVVDSRTPDGFRTIVNTVTGGVVTLGSNAVEVGVPKFANVQIGDVLVIVSGTGVTAGEYPITAVVSDKEVELGGGFTSTYTGSDVVFYIKRPDGLEANGIVFYDSEAEFITDGVAVGYKFVVESGTYAGEYVVTAVDSQNKLRIAQVPGVAVVLSPVTYHVYRDLERTEQAEFIKAYSQSYRNRRLKHMWPDVYLAPDGDVVRELPGYFGCCPPAALTTGLPTQQGFTNLATAGFSGTVHSADYFDEDQLNIIADGGTTIMVQDVDGAPLYFRHSLTTDRSTIKFQEYMVTKNVDYIAKFIRRRLEKYPGSYNIYQGTLAEISLDVGSAISYLRDSTIQPKIGGVIRGGKLVSIAEGATIDSLAVRIGLDIPIPLNNIDVTIVV